MEKIFRHMEDVLYNMMVNITGTERTKDRTTALIAAG